MTLESRRFYEFGAFRLEPADGVLLRDGVLVSIPPKSIEVLVALVENSGRVLSKDDLMSRVWPDSFVEQANLSHHIFVIRKALGGGPDGDTYIETIPRRGYRFVASVNEVRHETDMVLVLEQTKARIVIEEAAGDADLTSTGLASTPSLSEGAEASGFSRSYKARALLLAFAVTVLAGAGVLLWRVLSNTSPRPRAGAAAAAPRSSMMITRVTSSGNAANSTISPDGRFIAYCENHPAGAGTIRVRQVGTNSEVQLLPPGERVFGGSAFSSDGGFVYYTAYERDDPNGALWRVPLLGGPPARLIRNFSSMFTLSPDGQHVAFYRNDPDGVRRHLTVAAVDGSDEEILMTRNRRSLYFSGVPAWSPDGSKIAFGATTERGKQDLSSYVSLFTIEPGTREVKRLTDEQWIEIGKTVWIPDGSGLVFVAFRPRRGNQVYYLSYPGGELSRVTNDLLTYGNYGMGITADSSTLVADVYEASAQLWSIGADGDARRAEPVSPGKSDGHSGLAGLPDGRIVYTSRSGDVSDLWTMRSDGSETKPLTSDSYIERDISATRDGRYLVFASNRAGGSHIFRLDSDGSDLLQLTRGERIDAQPDCSPDGKWIAYASYSERAWTIWKVSIDGGDPVQLTDYESVAPSYSPDGASIACILPSESRIKNATIAVIGPDGGAPAISFAAIPFAYSYRGCRWAPDRHSVVYNVLDKKASNLWEQPLTGGPARQLTDFKSDHIFSFTYSRDGRRILLSRGQYIVNVVTIRDFR
jgi:Tol biopolymer transport system component/DNA-binding winged helix-turn-helix (wHTH) protein